LTLDKKKKKQQQKRLKLYQLLITSKKGNPIKFNNQREAQTNSITGTRRKKKPVRKKCKNHQRRHNPESQGLLKKLPQNGHIIIPENVRNQDISKLWRRQTDSTGAQTR
jgi:hypothetical protein